MTSAELRKWLDGSTAGEEIAYWTGESIKGCPCKNDAWSANEVGRVTLVQKRLTAAPHGQFAYIARRIGK